jgi:hypothetical protein
LTTLVTASVTPLRRIPPGRLRKRDHRSGAGGKIVQPPITVIIAGQNDCTRRIASLQPMTAPPPIGKTKI